MKTINALMRHMRQKGVSIQGSTQKNQLRTYGYYHGYKGYRFFSSNTPIPFSQFTDVVKVIKYDSLLKELLFPKLLFIETAIRSVALECIVQRTDSDSLSVFFDTALVGYRDYQRPTTTNQKRNAQMQQQRKNKLRAKLISNIAEAYEKRNSKITHYYELSKHDYPPLWAVFEICMMGELDFIVQSLRRDYRDDLSKELNMSYSFDTDVMVVSNAITFLRYLRNACAHNEVVYDARFTKRDPSSELKNLLKNQLGIVQPTFRRITDYVALICIFLRKLGVSKTDVRAFLKKFEKCTDDFEKSLPSNVASVILSNGWRNEVNCISMNI